MISVSALSADGALRIVDAVEIGVNAGGSPDYFRGGGELLFAPKVKLQKQNIPFYYPAIGVGYSAGLYKYVSYSIEPSEDLQFSNWYCKIRPFSVRTRSGNAIFSVGEIRIGPFIPKTTIRGSFYNNGDFLLDFCLFKVSFIL